VTSADELRYRAASASSAARARTSVPTPKVGDAIFAGTSYPRTWEDYIGQDTAKVQLRAACYDARRRQQRMDHALIATGWHGVGKTALAKLVAADLGTGIVEVQGKVSEDEGRAILLGMCDNDVLFWDEIHQAVSGGKVAVEWLLPVLQDGIMLTKRGVEVLPQITVLAATTDVQKLPETLISRFKVQPVMEPYTETEGAQIATVMARRLPDDLPQPDLQTCTNLTRAANHNPRMIDTLLVQMRIAALSGWAPHTEDGRYDLHMVFEWAGVTWDGLSDLAQRYLTVLLTQFDGVAGQGTIAAALGEPTAPRHTEKLLMQKELITITSKGRQLTEAGVERALDLLTVKGMLNR
jgi:holliday junction DNA helicase RuvB